MGLDSVMCTSVRGRLIEQRGTVNCRTNTMLAVSSVRLLGCVNVVVILTAIERTVHLGSETHGYLELVVCEVNRVTKPIVCLILVVRNS